jgi:hypothetical protein
MSFENYKINNFASKQALSSQDLNNLVSNDIILYNKIQSMPRGIIGFNKILEAHQSFNTFSAKITAPTEATFEGFQMIRQSTTEVFKTTFTVEDLRLIKFNFFASSFANATGSYTNPGHFRAAFFIEQNNGEEYMLNSNYKTSVITANILSGSISMNYIAQIPAGTHAVKVGIKAHKASIRIGPSTNVATRLTELYVEDLGAFTAPGAELTNEF